MIKVRHFQNTIKYTVININNGQGLGEGFYPSIEQPNLPIFFIIGEIEMTMETYSNGYIKKHKGCGGYVQFQENLNDGEHWEWNAWCLSCNKNIVEENIDFIKRSEPHLPNGR